MGFARFRSAGAHGQWDRHWRRGLSVRIFCTCRTMTSIVDRHDGRIAAANRPEGGLYLSIVLARVLASSNGAAAQ